MRSVNTFVVFMMYKFNYKENKNIGNLLPVIDEVYVKSVISSDKPSKNNKNKVKLKQKYPDRKLPVFDDALRKEWGDWYIPMKTFLNGMDKFKKKLPHFHTNRAVGFGVALEQATGEFIARWKAKEFPAKQVVSLTGGLGVDDWAWADTDCDVHSFDTNETLNFWSCLNFDRLGVSNKIHRYTKSAEWALENWSNWNSQTQTDIIYIDPDRRPETANRGSRVVSDVEAYSPNIFELYGTHRKKARHWLIKLSPMVDVHWFQSKLQVSIRAYALCGKKEVKEILVLLPGSEAISSSLEGHLQKEMVRITDTDCFSFSKFNPNDIQSPVPNCFETFRGLSKQKESQQSTHAIDENTNQSESFVFEPHAGLFALGLNHTVGLWPFVQPLGHHSFFKTEIKFPEWMGRTLKIKVELDGSLREISKRLKELHFTGITITARNCGIPTTEVVKQLGTRENSELHGFILKQTSGFTLFVGTI